MGFGLRFREKVRQVGKKGAQPDKNGFVATDYERVQLTYDEAVSFADSLKAIRKRIVDAHSARTKMLKEIEKTLTGTLPRVHEIDPVTGEHSTTEAAPEIFEGQDDYVRQGTLTHLADDNDIKVQQQVLNPIDKWISEVDLFKGKMKVLETMRLELDGSRRDHINIENKIAKAEAKQNEVNPKHTTHIQSKDASIAGKRTAYEQYEAQIYEELVNLIGDSGVLHTALDRAIKLEIEIFQRAADPITTTTARLENLSTAGASSGIGSPVSSAHYSTAGVGAGAGYGAGVGTGYGASAGTGYGANAGTGYGATAGTGYGASTGAGYGTGTGSEASKIYHATTAYPSAPTTTVPSSTGQAPSSVGATGQQVAYERPYAA